MAEHAPDLKVLVYEGWSKLCLPLEEDLPRVEEESSEQSDGEDQKLLKEKGSTSTRRKPKAKPVPKVSLTKGKRALKGKPFDEEYSTATLMKWFAYVQEFDVVVTTCAHRLSFVCFDY